MSGTQSRAGASSGELLAPAGQLTAECAACRGDGCDWHLSPTNGAVEIDRACPNCNGTGRTPR